MARKTFLQLQQECANYVGGDSTDTELLGVCGSGINAGIDQFNVYDWNAQTTTSGITLVAEQRDYTLPSDIQTVKEITLLNSSSEHIGRIRYRLPDVFERIHNPRLSTVVAGEPTEYTVYGEGSAAPTLRMSTKPSSNYVSTNPTAELRYNQEIPQLSGVDTMSVNRRIEQSVLWFAKSYVAAIYDPEKMQFAEARFQDLFDKELMQNNRGRILGNI